MSALELDLRASRATSWPTCAAGSSVGSSARCTARQPDVPDALSVRGGLPLAAGGWCRPRRSTRSTTGSRVIGLRVGATRSASSSRPRTSAANVAVYGGRMRPRAGRKNDHGLPQGARDRPSVEVAALALRHSPASMMRLFSAVLVLEDGQVAVQLPLRELDAVVVPLLALDLDVAVEDVRRRAPSA